MPDGGFAAPDDRARDRIMAAKTAFEAHSPRSSPRSRTARSTRKRSVIWSIGRSPRAPKGWFRSAPPAKARRCRTTSTRGRRMVRRSGARPGAGRGRRRLELDQGSDRSRAACREGGRRRGARGHALLQQADAGRALSALQGDQRRDRHSDPDLQYPAALGDRHVGRHHEAAVRAQEHRRRQGRDREHGARVAAARGDGRGFQSALRRGHHRARLHGAWRPRLHFGDLERGAAAVRRIPGGVPEGRLCRAR